MAARTVRPLELAIDISRTAPAARPDRRSLPPFRRGPVAVANIAAAAEAYRIVREEEKELARAQAD